MRKSIEDMLRRLPYLRQLVVERDELMAYRTWVPPGHFYSPLPSIEEIRNNEDLIFVKDAADLPGVNINETRQLSTLASFQKYSLELPFQALANDRQRYYYENGYFSYLDAIILYCMMREIQPKRIIEIGSGFSSCVILDTNELYFDDSIACTFVEPYPERLYSLIRESDRNKVTILKNKIQDVDRARFTDLEAGDILFIDSSHVSKIESDVNHILFEILPSLRNGVYIHFHDIFYPFEYPKEWIYGGVAWNEAYLLRAFLQYNTAFTIQFFNSFMKSFFKDQLTAALPMSVKDPDPDIEIKNAPAGSLWLVKER
jgi:predicted O-methyltransferase YrrM